MTSGRRLAAISLLITSVIEGFVPIIAKIVSSTFPPIFFIGAGSAIAMVIYGAYLFFSGGFTRRIPLMVILCACGVAIFNLTSMVLIFFAADFTSGVNIALVGQSEMVFAFLITTIFFGERSTPMQLLGAMLVFIGTGLVLYNGSLDFNRGDVLILFASAMFPIGNIFAKKALSLASSAVVLFFRYLFGATILLLLSFLFEDSYNLFFSLPMKDLLFLPLYGVLVLTISKVFWYTGLRVFPLSIATYVFAAVPAYSLLFAWLLLNEIPTYFQWVGFILSVGGLLLVIGRSSSAVYQEDLL